LHCVPEQRDSIGCQAIDPFAKAQDRLRAAKSKAGNPATIALFDFAAGGGDEPYGGSPEP